MLPIDSYGDSCRDRVANIGLTETLRSRSVVGARYSVLLFLLLVFSVSATHARTRARHSESWAREHFASAERMREALNGRPQSDRTRRDYQRVINAYRSTYFGAPASSKADPSVVAVAETLVEMGRRFEDDAILNKAIAQYKFLRKEYPGSKYRCDALFTIGEIYKDDLSDPQQARATFQEFLRRYPHNRLVDDAQQAVAELDRQAETEKKAEVQNQKKAERKIARDTPGNDAGGKPSTPAPDTVAQESSEHVSGRLPRVTGIRHWSTPDYTRVAIDLESDVKFFSQRIDNPDRIFFDLRDTKLASTLVGKSFDVDDGFLKKIRVAQFQPGRTRVVLEVDDLSDYDAFLLPNPYRLIVDIHGRDLHGKQTARNGKRTSAKDASAEDVQDVQNDAMTADVEAGPKAGSPKAESPQDDALSSEKTTEIAKADTPKVGLPKSEVKADMKALAGEPTSRKEEIHEQPKTVEKADDMNRAVSSKRHKATAKTSEVEVKTPTGTIKKVIVDQTAADDSDPIEAARAEAARLSPAEPSPDKDQPRSGRNSTPDGNSAASDEKPEADNSADAAADSKISTPRASSRSKKGQERARSIPSNSATPDSTADLGVREAKPTARGDRSLIRALGLKIGKIVIDPGHGGHDTGTIGPNGLEEKDLVLEVGRRLGKLLETRLGAEVVYTRKDDTFIPLETRTAVANQQRADLFVSIHANSSRDPAARGVETYYLNFTSSPEALEVAARENAVSEKSIYELQDLVKKIALKEKIEESREFAGDVEESLHKGLAAKSPGIRDRGVKKAPFIVLIGANMPSILAEISFVSNPGDERRLETAEYRQRIAESLYRGIAKYANGLSGVKVASNREKAAGQ